MSSSDALYSWELLSRELQWGPESTDQGLKYQHSHWGVSGDSLINSGFREKFDYDDRKGMSLYLHDFIGVLAIWKCMPL